MTAPNTNMIIGQLIRDARKRAGKTQAKLADCMGIDYQVVSDYENGRRSPGLDWLFRACDCLEVDFGELMTELDKRRKSAKPSENITDSSNRN